MLGEVWSWHEGALNTCSLLQVGKIREIRAIGKAGQIQVHVAWFYRPEEAMGGRKVQSFDLCVPACMNKRNAVWSSKQLALTTRNMYKVHIQDISAMQALDLGTVSPVNDYIIIHN